MLRVTGLATLVLLAATTGPAQAENSKSVELGMTIDQLMAGLEDGKELPIVDGLPIFRMIASEGRRQTIGLCRGRVVWITNELGKSLSDFVYQVKERDRLLGSATFSVYQARSSQGEQSFVTATWPTKSGSVSVRHGLTPWGGETVSLIRSAYPDSNAEANCR